MKRIKGYLFILFIAILGITFFPSFSASSNHVVILDNSFTPEQGVIITGDWKASTWNGGGEYFQTNYLHDKNADKGLKSIAFSPGIISGDYRVYIRYTASSNRADNVPVVINYSSVSDVKYVDQKKGGGLWHLLGEYEFAGNGNESVVIKNDDTNGYVIADAVAFVPDNGCGEGCFDDLISYWAFENPEIIVQDSSGCNLGWVNGGSSSQGKVGSCLEFDGDDFVRIGDSESLQLTEKFTLMAWVKSIKNGAYSKIISRRSGNYFYFLGIDNGKPYAGIGDNSSFTVSNKSFSMPVGEWHHLAMTFDTTKDEMNLYYDGRLKETITVTRNLPALENVALTLGADKQGTAHFFNGMIDEAAIFSSALDQARIRNLYLKGLNSFDICSPDLCGNGQIDVGEDCDGSTDCPETCFFPVCYATSIVSYSPGLQKNGDLIPPERSNPENALGLPENNDTINFVSLGFGGELIIGFENKVLNKDGDDLEIIETSFGSVSCDSYPEKIHVYGSQDGQNWTDLGPGCQDKSFDLGPLDWAKYIKLVDESNPDLFSSNTADGFDVDGINALHCSSGNTVNTPPTANPDSVETESVPIEINVLSNDYDTDGDELTIISFTQPSHGSVEMSSGQKFIFTPVTGYTGTDSFTYTISDTNGATGSADVNITIRPAMVEVPSVVGLNQQEAIIALESFGLSAGTVEHIYDQTIPAGIIIDQSPSSGIAVESDTPVDLVVSLGPPGALPSVQINADPNQILQGASTTLSWISSNGTSAYIEPEIGTTDLNGSAIVSPDHTTTYTITVTGGGGTCSSTVTVFVNRTNELQPRGSFGEQYNDIIPSDATIGVYDPKRFSLVTGLVFDVTGHPLSGVEVIVFDHPEYGTVYTDDQGRFTIPVEGGGNLKFIYNKMDYLEVHRQVYVPWNDFAVVDTITMLKQDPQSTTLSFDGNPDTIITHQSTPVTDEFGTRFCSMVFTGDNQAFIVDENGNDVHQLQTITTRATEYTTPESMPAVLPPNSAFTYCAELSVDGVKRVRFDKPVVIWINNFLGFNVGGIVPVGYYDQDKGFWIASDNGVVVRLLDTDDDGMVDALDADGDDIPDDLNGNLDFSDEVKGLDNKNVYIPGQTYWRVSMSHFTPMDCNWARGLLRDSYASVEQKPDIKSSISIEKQRDVSKEKINCNNSFTEARSRIFHEDIPILGTDLTLHYASNRTLGFNRCITVPACEDTIPDSVSKIIVQVTALGRRYEQLLDPLPNQSARFCLNGLDYLDRRAPSPHKVRVSIGYQFDAVYFLPEDIIKTFARSGISPSEISTRWPLISWQHKEIVINTGPTAVMQGEGILADGWTISNHHHLSKIDPGVLHKGNGMQTGAYDSDLKYRRIDFVNQLEWIAGTGEGGFSGDYANARQAQLYNPKSIVSDGSGNIYVADSINKRVRKIDSNGIITTIAGNGNLGSGFSSPDIQEVTATDVPLYFPDHMAVDDSGNVYFLDDSGECMGTVLRKIDKNGMLSNVAGSDFFDQCGVRPDNEIATSSLIDLSGIQGVDVDKNASVFMADYRKHGVQKVHTSGIMSKIAGSGSSGYSGDGGFSRDAQLSNPRDVKADSSGNIYIVDWRNHVIRKIDSSGLITTVAGSGNPGYTGDGGPASEADLYNPTRIDLDSEGNLYIVDQSGKCIRKVDTGGNIWTISNLSDPDSITRLKKDFPDPPGGLSNFLMNFQYSDIDVDNQGNIYVVSSSHHLIFKISGLTPYYRMESENNNVYTENGGLGHVFDSDGCHIKTVNLETGATISEFGYITIRGKKLLISVTDRFGNSIKIERNENNTMAIVSPYGQRTILNVDYSNNLREVIYPDGSSYQFDYSAGGLMESEIDPAGNIFTRSFESSGKILSVQDEEAGNWVYDQQVTETGALLTTITSAENNQTTHLDKTDETGTYTSTTTDVAGAQSIFTQTGLFSSTQAACGAQIDVEYDIDPEYQYRYPSKITSSTPSGLAKTIEIKRTYAETTSPPSRTITQTMTTNGKTLTQTHELATQQKTVTTPHGRVTTLDYEPFTFLNSKISVPGLFDTAFDYDDHGRLKTSITGTRTTQSTYNAEGFLESITNPMQETTHYTRDTMGRVIKTQRSDGSALNFNYDANGNMTILTTPGSIDHTFNFNTVELKDGYTAPLSGSYLYHFDKDRRQTAKVFPSGRQINNIYANGKLGQVQTPEGVIDFTYNCGSQLSTIAKGQDLISYSWDGSLITSDTISGTLNHNTDYTYNNDFNPAVMTYAGSQTHFSYDNDDLLVGSGSFVIHRNEQNGLPESVTDGSLNIARTYNGYGEIESELFGVGSINKLSWTLVRDDNGRIINKTQSLADITSEYTYSYDSLGRLLSVTENGTMTEEYRYGINGSRTYEMNTARGITGRTLSYSDEDHLLSAGDIHYSYNLDGFLSTKTQSTDITSYDYSSRGELLSVSMSDGRLIEYIHDPIGRRIAKKVNGEITEKYLWKGMTTLLAVYGADDNLRQRFEYADSRMPVAMTSEGIKYYLGYDQVGSLSIVADALGNVIKQIQYDSFGNILSDSNPDFNIPFGFAGGLHDRDTGLVRFGHRDYDPETGRWTAKDPIFFEGGDTDLYGYVLNDPINKIDPLGLINILLGGGGSAIAPTGAEASVGIVINPGIGKDKADIGVFGSVGAGGGVNISADAFLGFVKGGIVNVSGLTQNINITIGPISLTFFTDLKTGNLLGGTIGLGPGATPVGSSGTISTTGTLTLRDLFSSDKQTSPCY